MEIAWTPLNEFEKGDILQVSQENLSTGPRKIKQRGTDIEVHKGTDRSLLDDDVQDEYLKKFM
jgi:hypothetical protein